jgi:hypothetical protein
VAECDRPARGIEQMVDVDPDLTAYREDLGCERFVELDDIDVVDRQPGS